MLKTGCRYVMDGSAIGCYSRIEMYFIYNKQNMFL